jgi:RNA polymerase sigma-70 factor (ECF subfamily)
VGRASSRSGVPFSQLSVKKYGQKLDRTCTLDNKVKTPPKPDAVAAGVGTAGSVNDSILARVARGDAGAFDECVREFGGLVAAIARRTLRSRPDAEDAVQEILVELWRSAGRYDPEQGTEKVFVTTIARRRLIDRMRRLKPDRVHESQEALEDLRWAEPGNRGEIACDAVRAAGVVARLRSEQRSVLRMGLIEGMTHSEIARATGMPLGTVKTQMRRGLIQVRQWLRVGASTGFCSAVP